MKQRRNVLLAGLAGVASLVGVVTRPAQATPEAQQAAVQAFTGGRMPRDGRVQLTIAELIDNGNVVPVNISVDSPMTPTDHVQRIALFTERNPAPEVVVFHLGPHNGAAQVATRMRLATSQTLTAVAVMNDGSVWQQRVDVIVTLAACIES
jgi:sulfur-oxidizing protein SoxY